MGKFFNGALALSSARDDWTTPQPLFDKLNAVWHFTLDVAASAENTKCPLFYDKAIDGLQQPWSPHICWANVPYGRTIKLWLKKGYGESLLGATVMMLLPSRTGTSWYHEYCLKGCIEFLKGRLKFGDGKNTAPFDSMLVLFLPPQ